MRGDSRAERERLAQEAALAMRIAVTRLPDDDPLVTAGEGARADVAFADGYWRFRHAGNVYTVDHTAAVVWRQRAGEDTATAFRNRRALAGADTQTGAQAAVN